MSSNRTLMRHRTQAHHPAIPSTRSKHMQVEIEYCGM